MAGRYDDLKRRVLAGERATADDALYMLGEADLLPLFPLANHLRYKHNPQKRVTYVVDTNLNYSNICDAYCSFCAFYRTDPSDPSAYTYTVEQIMEKIGRYADRNITTVLMQGGLNSNLPFEYYTNMVKECRRRFPQITPHFWSAPEIWRMCEVSGKTLVEVFESLWEAGQHTMPGGGAEILTDRARQATSRFHPKDTWRKWTDVHEAAHAVGFKTTATMMYGHVENDAEIAESLEHIRDVQDKALANANGGGFTAFIPWSYKRANTALAKQVKSEAGSNRYLRVIATARIFLENVPHIQASWFSEGRKTGQVALHAGADDFGGTLYDENVMLAAGYYNRTTEDEIHSLIREVGFVPAQRQTNYDIVRVLEEEPAPAAV